MASDSDSSDCGILNQALPIAKLPKNYKPNDAPASAEEYLHHVVWEARQCQAVVTVDLEEHRLNKPIAVVQKQVKAAAPDGFTPSLESQQNLLASFSKLRAHIANLNASGRKPKPPIPLPGIKKREEWCKLCFGNSFQLALLKQSHQDSVQPQLIEGKQPLLSILLNIKQKGIENLLEWHGQWLEVLGFSEAQGRWFYSLLACLEKPLTPETCSQIRHIAMMCARIRASLETADHPHLPQLNVIICIVARYFCQEDLVDH